MRGIIRLIHELQAGNPAAVYVLVFAVVGTVVLVVITQLVQRSRRTKTSKGKM